VFLVFVQFLSQGILLFDDLLIVAVACFFCVDMTHTVSSSSLTLLGRLEVAGKSLDSPMSAWLPAAGGTELRASLSSQRQDLFAVHVKLQRLA
jgi:hypothetical protein